MAIKLVKLPLYALSLCSPDLNAFPDRLIVVFVQARTCLLFGDDPRRVTQMEQMVGKHIGCKVVQYGVKNHQAKGHDQEAFNMQPNEVLFKLLYSSKCITFFISLLWCRTFDK